MNKIFPFFFICVGIFMNCQKTESGNYAYPPAPGYNKNYPSPYEKNKGKIPEAPMLPQNSPKKLLEKWI